MDISGINSINAINESGLFSSSETANSSKTSFSDWLQKEINVANTQINTADNNLRQYAIGETDNLHHVMMSIEEAKTSFELVMQVRNKLLEGYQEIMRMQI